MTDLQLMNTAGHTALPNNVRPSHYDLTLEVDLENFTFSGKVIITLDVVDDSTTITLHASKLLVEEVSLFQTNNSVQIRTGFDQDEDSQTIIVQCLESVAQHSTVHLSLEFGGQLDESLSGLFRAKYVDEHGAEKFVVASQLAPIDARRVFPCFDEPALKATFRTTIVADKRLTCLSNMNVESEMELDQKRKAVTFSTTPRMSTYLLCVAVGDFRYVETSSFHVPVRVYFTPEIEPKTAEFALDLAAKSLSFFEQHFGMAFPLPKMDLLVVNDFIGAMENWGLVTFSRTALLFDDAKADSAAKNSIVNFVTHELAHQWFGNLVTMDWWEGLWLNEGFATWAEVFAMQAFYPEWRPKEALVSGDMHAALELDSLRSSHPVEVPIECSSDIDQIFDDVSYKKGSCVIRLAAEYLGEDVFLEGVRYYFKKHAYGNTTTEDLWNALSHVSGKPVKQVIGPWTQNVGYPILSVEERGSHLHIEQHRFLRTGDIKGDEDNVLYPVPLALRTSASTDTSKILIERECSVEIEGDFFLLNSGRIGFYRTLYSSDRLAKLTANRALLSTIDRIGLIDDVAALAPAGYQDIEVVLDLLDAFRDEEQLDVWIMMSRVVSSVKRAWNFEPAPIKEALKAFERHLVGKQVHRLGWTIAPEDDFATERLKVRLFRHAALAGDPIVRQAALDMFRRFVAGDKDAINPNLLGPVLETAMSSDDVSQEDYDAVLRVWRGSKDNNEQDRALTALGHVRKPELLQQTIALMLSLAIKLEEIPTLFEGIATDSDGIEAAWEILRGNFEVLEQRFQPSSMYVFAWLIEACVGQLTTETAIEEARLFFEGKNTEAYRQGLDQSFDEARVKNNWVRKDSERLKKWLEGRGFLKVAI